MAVIERNLKGNLFLIENELTDHSHTYDVQIGNILIPCEDFNDAIKLYNNLWVRELINQ